ncbi:hypothetical protein WN55_01824 [Dufourea novaeangliae]|uniref:DUF4817 domain-containing protein n=1 Tax=Dufourea novaeangliae TaxID=178035 RepID=A0A154PG56_DUFNO|nr:hypothetical protein WN55_01824 [Dufourea novaeangliae]
MLLIYDECQQKFVRAKNMYAERYPHRPPPSRRTFKNMCDKLIQTGSLSVRKSECRKRVTNEQNEIGVLGSVATNPHISSRQIERESGISSKSVLLILHCHKFHPYHVILHQQLQRNDFMNRVEFCRWAKHQIHNNEVFLNTVLFTDEATFTNHGNVNLQNMHLWAAENPHWLRQVEH